MYSFGKRELWALGGLLILLIPAMLLNLGVVPLYAEEPRRATVALEMLLRHNWLVPSINGEFYQLKPPVFNWILASIYSVTDDPSEFFTRLTSVVSLLVLGLVIFWSGKKYVSTSFGALSSLLFVTASGNLFFNVLLAEIDIFYSLVTYTGLISLFHFYQRKKFFTLFLTIYLLGAIGTLTKGLPSLLFTGLSVLAFFIVNRDFRKLFTLAHFSGILLFLVIIGVYFLAYSRQGDAISYMLNLSVESGKRFSGDTFWDYLQHMALYPLDTLMNLLPVSVMLLFAFRKSFMADIRASSFMSFTLLMLAVHFPVYWLPPGGRQRYIIMLYPFIVQVLAYFYLLYFTKEKRVFRVFTVIITIAIAFGALACLVPLFVDRMDFINGLMPVCISSFTIMALLLIFQVKKPLYSVISLMFAMVILRFVFSVAVLPVRATEGRAPANKQAALEIARMTEGEQVCILQPTYFPMQSVFYFERERMEILQICPRIRPGIYHIIDKGLLQEYSYYRESNTLTLNPLHSFSDRFSGDDEEKVSDYLFTTHLEFQLQKTQYLLIRPIRPRL